LELLRRVGDLEAMTGDPDAIVIGAGPNGLVAGCVLARAGWSVLVLEANAEPGGAVRSAEVTEPGFVHDLGAAFFPFGSASPALVELDLPGVGLSWQRGAIDSAHPAPDGTCASIAADLEETGRVFGGLREDGAAFVELGRWFADNEQAVLDLLLGPLPPLRNALRAGPRNLAVLAEVGLQSGRAYAARFRAEAARRVIPGLALHTDVGPDDPCGAAVGFMLAMLASSRGFAVPRGGAGAITRALVARLEEAGGVLRTRVQVQSIITRGGEAVGVRTARGEEHRARRAVVADTSAPALYLSLLAEADVPARVTSAMRRFPYGFGTFKLDWALSGPVPFSHPDAARAAVVHAGDSLDDLARFAAEVHAGKLPDNPYLVIGQQSLLDPSRAPAGCHTLWAYSRVPSQLEGGWKAARERFADRVEARIEGLAPGFRALVRARRIYAPDDLERLDQNLVGGDLGGGSARIGHQLFFRPVFPFYRYRTPVKRLYLGSSYTHPGAGVHGACGRNAARAALEDWGG
jgi:phytoene dehydrogenase-like protein